MVKKEKMKNKAVEINLLLNSSPLTDLSRIEFPVPK